MHGLRDIHDGFFQTLNKHWTLVGSTMDWITPQRKSLLLACLHQKEILLQQTNNKTELEIV